MWDQVTLLLATAPHWSISAPSLPTPLCFFSVCLEYTQCRERRGAKQRRWKLEAEKRAEKRSRKEVQDPAAKEQSCLLCGWCCFVLFSEFLADRRATVRTTTRSAMQHPDKKNLLLLLLLAALYPAPASCSYSWCYFLLPLLCFF